ncbi:hypothetical protein E4U40_003732 [Claviceps sp. LM458 group G5]|nr:hypothetical protein E4U40_003732 [Claviceps sp. LM458 group G5]
MPPGELDILILRPSLPAHQPHVINFAPSSTFGCSLMAPSFTNRSDYGDITIDEEVLSRLPDNGDANAELQTKDIKSMQSISGIGSLKLRMMLLAVRDITEA